MVSVCYSFRQPTGDVGRHNSLDGPQDREQALLVVSAADELETDGGIVVRRGVPLLCDERLYAVPRVGDSGALELLRVGRVLTDGEHDGREVEQVPVGRIRPPAGRVVGRGEGRCDGAEDRVDGPAGGAFGRVPVLQCGGAECLALAVETEDLVDGQGLLVPNLAEDPLCLRHGRLLAVAQRIAVFHAGVEKVEPELGRVSGSPARLPRCSP